MFSHNPTIGEGTHLLPPLLVSDGSAKIPMKQPRKHPFSERWWLLARPQSGATGCFVVLLSHPGLSHSPGLGEYPPHTLGYASH